MIGGVTLADFETQWSNVKPSTHPVGGAAAATAELPPPMVSWDDVPLKPEAVAERPDLARAGKEPHIKRVPQDSFGVCKIARVSRTTCYRSCD